MTNFEFITKDVKLPSIALDNLISHDMETCYTYEHLLSLRDISDECVSEFYQKMNVERLVEWLNKQRTDE
jgi:hypothetical protein